MTNQDQKKQDDQNRFNQVAAVVTGAVVGAGVAVVGAVVMGDKKNREKVKKVFNDAKDQAAGYVEEFQKKVEYEKGEIKKDLVKGRKLAKKMVLKK